MTINNPYSDTNLDFLEHLLQDEESAEDEEIMIVFLATAAAANNVQYSQATKLFQEGSLAFAISIAWGMYHLSSFPKFCLLVHPFVNLIQFIQALNSSALLNSPINWGGETTFGLDGREFWPRWGSKIGVSPVPTICH